MEVIVFAAKTRAYKDTHVNYPWLPLIHYKYNRKLLYAKTVFKGLVIVRKML